MRGPALALALWFACAAGASAAQPVPLAEGPPWSAAEVAGLAARLDRLTTMPAIRGAHLGFYAVSTSTGAVLYARAADQGFVPASTLKTITGSVALDRLGPQFRFQTTVLGDAGSDGDVHGDIVLRGGGDPLLSARDLDAAAAALAASGVDTIEGGIALDLSAFDREPFAPGWMIEDLPFDYSAPVSGLMVEENVVHLKVSATTEGAPAEVDYWLPTSSVTIENVATTGAAGSAQTIGVARDGAALRIFGSIPAGKVTSVDAAVPDPNAYAADLFARALAAHGITFDPPLTGPPHLAAAGSEATVLWTHDSDPLAKVLRWFWFRSDNLVGEALLKTLDAAASGAPGTTEGGVRLERSALRAMGLDPATLAIVDGSGLSRYDTVTPRALVGVLQSDWRGPNRATVVDALPLAGLRGSMRSTFIGTPAEGRLYAKTGSMRHVWNLAGYVQTLHHGAVTFALMTDDFAGDEGALEAIEARIFAALVRAP